MNEFQITYHGQPIAAIIATDHETARRAANAVVVETVKEKAIITVEVRNVYLLSFKIHSSRMQSRPTRSSPTNSEFTLRWSTGMNESSRIGANTQKLSKELSKWADRY